MSFWTRVKSALVSETAQRCYTAVKPDHVNPPQKYEEFEPNETYLRVWLNDMYLTHNRVLYSTRIPIVHALCRFLYQGSFEIVPIIAGPGQIKELSFDLENVLNINHRLIGPVPFTGGEVEIVLALFALEIADYGDQFLEVLGTLSELTCSGELKTAFKFMQPLKKGLEGLLNLKKTTPHLGIHDTFTSSGAAPQPLIPGYRVIINAPSDDIDLDKLWVDRGRLLYGTSLDEALPFKGADYLLFYIERLAERDDWSILASISQAWDEVIIKANKEDDKELSMAINNFMGLVFASQDLIWSDQVRLIDALKKRVKKIHQIKTGLRSGWTVRENERFCMHCGAKMSLEDNACPRCGLMPPSGIDVKTCISCGEIIPSQARVCPVCGYGTIQYDIISSLDEEAVPIEEAKKKTREDVLRIPWRARRDKTFLQRVRDKFGTQNKDL